MKFMPLLPTLLLLISNYFSVLFTYNIFTNDKAPFVLKLHLFKINISIDILLTRALER
jgi:hypothetical protein